MVFLGGVVSIQLNAAEKTQLTTPTQQSKPANPKQTSPTLKAIVKLDVPEMLLGMGAALNSGNYTISYVYIHDGQLDSLRLSHLSQDSDQLDMLEHLQGPKRMVVSHNGNTWLYTGTERLLISREDESPVTRWRRQLSRLSRNIANYKVLVTGLSRVAGRIAYQVNFIATDDSRNSTRLWIDTEFLLPLKIESLNSEKKVTEQLLAVNLNNPASLSETDFVPGEGYINEVDLQSEFSKKQSQEVYQGDWSINWLPAGFELSLRKEKQSKTNQYEHWIYSDGLSTLSVFIEHNKDNRKNKTSTFVSGDELIFDLSLDNKRVTIVGNIPVSVAKKIAESVVLNPPMEKLKPSSAQK